MAFAAAAVVGARRGAAGRLGSSGYRAPPPSLETVGAAKGPNVATGIATCVCSILVPVGLTSIAHSFANERQELVREYDSSVELWTAEAHDVFARSRFNVEAIVNSPDTSLAMDMRPMNSSEIYFHDAEEGEGLLGYTPLRFEADLSFDSYYPQTAKPDRSNGVWPLLPTRNETAKVVFRFSIRNLSGHLTTFSTQPWPLAYDEVVRPRTPAPENKCRQHQHGVWRDRHCHVVKYLSSVCIQVDLAQAGAWQLNSKSLPLENTISVDYSLSKTGGAFVAGGVQETYGCDPQMSWHPATWSIDPCWGRGPQTQIGKCSSASSSPHRVSVVVRSALDPYIRAEELTNNSFNFGLGPASQRVYGLMMVIVGCVLCVVPCLRIREQCEKGRRSRDDVRPLKYIVTRESDFADAETLYGDQSL